MNVRTIRPANEDAADTAVKLEIFRSGWGEDFEDEMRRAVKAIGPNPRMYARTEDGPAEPENREYYIARFEYRVIYAIWKGEAVVVAVIHARHRPGAWVGRLAELDQPEEGS